MPRFPTFLLPAAGVLLFFAAPVFAGDEILPVSEIRAGMKGYGLTVFEGTRIERFDVEVVGVLRNFEPHMDLIVVRCDHPLLEHTGICGGMSGSPVYLEGKLVGAASRFFKLFPKDLLAGVTPIERMLEDAHRPLRPEAAAAPPPPNAPKKAGAAIGFERIPAPLFVSGLGPRAQRALAEGLEGLGLDVQLVAGGVGGGAAGDWDTPDLDLGPGSAFGVQLVRGDLDISSGGTVTWREGDRILGFGHPFFGAGAFGCPVTTANVFTVMSSQQRSDKMQVTGREMGALEIDRISCVAGRLGKKVEMLPVTLRTRNLSTDARETFRFESIRHPLFTPLFLNVSLLGALESAESTMESSTARVRVSMRMRGREEPVVLEDTVSEPAGIGTGRPGTALLRLWNNPFGELGCESVEADVEVLHERKTAEIQAVWVDQAEAAAGEEVTLVVLLRPYAGDAVRREVRFQLPANLPPETYSIEVSGGRETAPDAAEPESVEGLLSYLQAQYRGSDLVTVVELGTIGTRQEGKVLRKLPLSVFGTLLSAESAGVTIAPDTLRVVTPTEYVLSGKKSVNLKIRPPRVTGQ